MLLDDFDRQAARYFTRIPPTQPIAHHVKPDLRIDAQVVLVVRAPQTDVGLGPDSDAHGTSSRPAFNYARILQSIGGARRAQSLSARRQSSLRVDKTRGISQCEA